MIKYSFAILITTKNRFDYLVFTLEKIQNLLHREDVECIICDDGSTDNTEEYLKKNHPQIKVLKNEKSKGLIYSRNRLLDMTTADFAISLDDDAHFITDNPLELIQNYFENNSNCAVLGFRIFWSLNEPVSINTNEKPHRVKGFVGCAHVWRMSSWRTIVNYPEWFVFYGEEGLLKQKVDKEVSYLFLNKNFSFDLLALFKLRKYIIKNKIQIVHTHGTSYFIGFLLKIITPNIKLVWHEHYGNRISQKRM
jgi:glycosyltransferase involved in cell wall biosynthesis